MTKYSLGLTFSVMKKIFHPLILTVAPTFTDLSWVERVLQRATFLYLEFFYENFFQF